MAHPIIIQESTFRNYLENFQEVIRPAQWMYFETVLMGLIHCQASRTLGNVAERSRLGNRMGTEPFPGQSDRKSTRLNSSHT